MNKIITTYNGGFPYVLDDIRWTQDAWTEALRNLSFFALDNGLTNFVLWGCTVLDAGPSFSVSPGAVIIQGEIYSVPLASGIVKVGGQNLEIIPNLATFDPAGLKTFQDAANHDTYNIRIATAVMQTPSGTGVTLSTVGLAAIPLKRDYMMHNTVGVSPKILLGNTLIDNAGTYFAANNITPATVPFGFWKRGNVVEFEGGFAQSPATSPIVSLQVGTLPPGYRPSTRIILNGFSHAGNVNQLFEINTLGAIFLRGDLIVGQFNNSTGITLNGSFSI